MVIWLTGLPGAGKTELAYTLERRLFDLGKLAMVLDPGADAASTDSGGQASDAVIETAKRAAETGLIAITAFASPRAADRHAAANIVGESRFIEVHVAGGQLPAGGRAESPVKPAATVTPASDTSEYAADGIIAELRHRALLD
jgi:adenylylsulfate kinase-like enzyme